MGCSMNTPTRTVGRASSCVGRGQRDGLAVSSHQATAEPLGWPEGPRARGSGVQTWQKRGLGQAAPSRRCRQAAAQTGGEAEGSRRRRSLLGRASLDLEPGPTDGLLSESLAGMGLQ